MPPPATHHGDRQRVLDRIEEEDAVEIAGSELVDDTSPLEHRLDVVEGEAVALEHDPAGGLGCRASGSNEDAAAPQVGDRPDVAGATGRDVHDGGKQDGHRAQPGMRAWVVGRALPVGEVGRPCPFEGQVDLAALERLGARLRVEGVPRADLDARQLVVRGPEGLADRLKDAFAGADGDHDLPRWIVGTHLLTGREPRERDRERDDMDGPADAPAPGPPAQGRSPEPWHRIAVVSYAP